MLLAGEFEDGVGNKKKLGYGQKVGLIGGEFELGGEKVEIEEHFPVDGLGLDDCCDALFDLEETCEAGDVLDVPVDLAGLEDAGFLVDASHVGPVDAIAHQKAHQ